MAATPENQRTESAVDRAAARAALVCVREQIAAIQASCLKTGTMTEGQQAYSAALRAQAKELMEQLGGNLQVVKKLMGDRLIVGGDYKEYLKLDLGKEGRLPVGIEEILGRECPVYGAGKKVFQTHILAWVPAAISLEKLSKAVGGQDGSVLYSNWFLEAEHQAIGQAELPAGKWILIPDKCPPQTKGKNWDDTVDALKAYPTYEQADVLSFATALIMRERKSGERHYAEEWAWCKDLPWGAAGGALSVGAFDAGGLDVSYDDRGIVGPWFGAAASWNFGNR